MATRCGERQTQSKAQRDQSSGALDVLPGAALFGITVAPLKEHEQGVSKDTELAPETTIRDIRSSEKLFCKKVLEIYVTSADDSASAPSSKLFLQTVQNKRHWAAHGLTGQPKAMRQ